MNNKITIDFEEYKELQKIAIESTKIVDLQKENEKLKRQIFAQSNVYSDLEDKYITLKYIIKEVREYVEKNFVFYERSKILEILDKENK